MTDISPRQSLAEYFDLPGEPGHASWAFLVQNPGRVAEFLGAYDKFDDPWDKRILMELVIASYDAYISDFGNNLLIEDKVMEIVKCDWALHSETVRYWTSLDSPPDPEGWNWPVTPFMLRVWQACSSSGDA